VQRRVSRLYVISNIRQYEHNMVFAGRNWNNGETVGERSKERFLDHHLRTIAELVLRRPDGSFLPTYWLLSTLCHEVGNNSALS